MRGDGLNAVTCVAGVFDEQALVLSNAVTLELPQQLSCLPAEHRPQDEMNLPPARQRA